MSEYLPCVEIEPATEADAAVIWLHGLGADGHDFAVLVPELRLPPSMAIRFILPHAPRIPVTLNAGHVMPAWFDIMELGPTGRKFNAAQLLASAAAVHALIDREIARGIDSERIILAGFSQGGAVNFQAGLTYDKPLAGILALSTYFPTAQAIEIHPANHGIPIQIFHGTEDLVLALALAEESRDKLRALGLHPDFKTYPMAHTLCPEEVRDISAWFQEILHSEAARS
ncbi:MAG: dienelactone hydrolase family protein [Pseudomonadales bacterium]|nr:dienelactone hydrolase family protein [Pseudomonadales bacterium]